MFWRKFLVAKLPQIGVFLLVLGLYLAQFILWHLPLMAFVNSSLLGLVLFIIYLFFSYFRWKNMQVKLQDLSHENERLQKELNQQILASKDFDDIIQVWSHQMKVPLAAIDLMTQTQIDENELRDQIFTLENYLKILLEYQRLNNVSTDFRFDEFSLSAVTKNLVRKYSSFFIKKGLTVNFVSSHDWIVTSDERWFSIALEQFINNAAKYTQTGGVTVEIEPGKLVISDTGIGILKEDLPRLFEHGFTGYNGRIQQKSTGLGLYLARLILDKLGFAISIDSEIGQGTNVTIMRKPAK